MLSLRRCLSSFLVCRVVSLLLAVLLPISALPATPAAAAPSGPVILVLGDSLSAGYGLSVNQGWVSLLQARLRNQGYGHRVVNASVSGETTTGALARLPRALELHRPMLVIVELGGNDGLRGLPVAQLRNNLDRIVQTCLAAGARVIVTGIRIPSNYGPDYTEKFHAVYAEVAKARRTSLVPFFMAGVANDDSLFQPDGIHPNASAQPRLLENVWPVLMPLLGPKR
jgi:acyl-CoA thioesterase-1